MENKILNVRADEGGIVRVEAAFARLKNDFEPPQADSSTMAKAGRTLDKKIPEVSSVPPPTAEDNKERELVVDDIMREAKRHATDACDVMQPKRF